MPGYPCCCLQSLSTCSTCSVCPNGCGPDHGLSVSVDGIVDQSTGEQCVGCTDWNSSHTVPNGVNACAGSLETRGCTYFSTATTATKFYMDRIIDWEFTASTEVGKNHKLTVDIFNRVTEVPGSPFDVWITGGGRYQKHFTSTQQCDDLSSELIPYLTVIPSTYPGSVFDSTYFRCDGYSTANVKVSSY